MSQQTRPSGKYVAITPSNSTNLETVNGEWPRAIFVGGDGNIAVVGFDDAAVTFTGAVAGQIIPISYKRINSTNTTATALVALY